MNLFGTTNKSTVRTFGCGTMNTLSSNSSWGEQEKGAIKQDEKSIAPVSLAESAVVESGTA